MSHPTGLASSAERLDETSMSPSTISSSCVRARSAAALRSALKGNSVASALPATSSLYSVSDSWQPPAAASILQA